MLESLFEGGRTNISEATILLRLTLAAVFGAMIGLDREIRGRPAGLRTHMLTALAASMFTVLTLELFAEVSQDSASRVSADPIRVIEAVTAGVAFLAAGAIIQSRGDVHGLTTGAGMWLAGAIGVACGVGFYSVAIIGLILALLILVVLKAIEDWAERVAKSEDGDSPD